MKIGTTLESELYDRVLRKAKERGLRVNEVFEAALRAYLDDENSEADYITQSVGSYRVSDEAFLEVLEADIYEP